MRPLRRIHSAPAIYEYATGCMSGLQLGLSSDNLGLAAGNMALVMAVAMAVLWPAHRFAWPTEARSPSRRSKQGTHALPSPDAADAHANAKPAMSAQRYPV
jgi:hypothetical protein